MLKCCRQILATSAGSTGGGVVVLGVLVLEDPEDEDGSTGSTLKMRPERPCPIHSPSFMVKFGGRSCKPVSTGSGLGTSVRRRRTGMGRVGSSSTQTGLTRSGGSGERFSNTSGSGVVVVPSPEMASRRVSVSDSRDAGAGADSDSDYMMMMMMREWEVDDDELLLTVLSIRSHGL